MSTPSATLTKNPSLDLQLEKAIQDLITQYAPLAHDRRRVTFTVADGVIQVAGNLRSRITYLYLTRNLPLIAGVKAVDTAQVYNDDDLRLIVGKVLPRGVYATLDSGAVRLTGTLPADADLAELSANILAIDGVQHVTPALTNA